MSWDKRKIVRDYTLDAGEPLPADGVGLLAPTRAGIARSALPPTMANLSVAGGRDEVTYDRRAADLLAEICAWSYSDSTTLLDALHERGIIGPGTTCREISVSNEPMLVVATAYYIQSGNVGVLCFRGTEPRNAINFLTDLSVNTRDFLSMGRVHGGFYRNLRAVWNGIEARVQEAIDETDAARRLKALYITGHSLGAAMAVLAAAKIFGDEEYRDWQELVRGVYTYGQPMAGDANFARTCEALFGGMLFRHVYEKDVVARLPPITTGHFKHFGAEYAGNDRGCSPRVPILTQTLSAAVSIPIGAAAFIFKQLPLLSNIRLPFSIDDHSPNSYLEAFKAARG